MAWATQYTISWCIVADVLLRLVLRRWVRRNGDDRVERLFSGRRAQRMLMRRLARSFSPRHARSFEGAVGFSLSSAHRPVPSEWTVVVADERARAVPGLTPHPVLHVNARLADLVRVLVGELATEEVLLGGRASVRGRLIVASRLDEMFRISPKRHAA
jgi:hypothetical protein